jgi:hypothetical protein
LVRNYLSVFEEAEGSMELSKNRWSIRTLENARDIVSVLSDGVSQITLSSGSEIVSPTQRVAATVDYLIAPAYEDYGTLEGRLETLSVHRKTRFNIYDPLTGQPISCSFRTDKLEEAHAAFNKRVAISGSIKYGRIGNPVSIQVDNIRVLEGGVRTSEFRDTDLTGGIDSGTYVRSLRDG